jgi:hypothetical protein
MNDKITNSEKRYKYVYTIQFYKCWDVDVLYLYHFSIQGVTTETSVKRTGLILLYFVISLKG